MVRLLGSLLVLAACASVFAQENLPRSDGDDSLDIEPPLLIKNALQARKLRGENREFRKQLESKSVIVGESVPTKALRQQIGRDVKKAQHYFALMRSAKTTA